MILDMALRLCLLRIVQVWTSRYILFETLMKNQVCDLSCCLISFWAQFLHF